MSESPSLPTLRDLFGASPSLARAVDGIERAARSGATLLIVGEAGSGRTALARACHAASSVATGPLVEVDAGTIPLGLFESELFGHRAGAFSGATSASPGRVSRAAGGTLLLDHVEELPLAVQPKLLQLFAERLYLPLGGAAMQTDARFVAIAGEDLGQRVRTGAFREDLYYRLAVLTFRVPPLRERRGDLPALIAHLLAELGQRFGRPGLSLGPRASAWMQQAPWPGNLRQVRNVLERALVLTDGNVLDPAPDSQAGGEGPPVTLETLEIEHLRRTLAYTRGHQGKAARLLGISRKALWEKRKRYGIP
jgi:DNA-binding NtrC family response regulator